jgi:DNA-repair protein complementing XP-A cells
LKEAEKIQQMFEEEVAEDVPLTYYTCKDCDEQFVESYLQKSFDFNCCDKCKDLSGAHELITKTNAREEYLLKDCDFDYREPALKFIARANPHKQSWAEMKLYLRLQVEARALEVHGSLEAIKNKKELREEKREVGKIKKYNKELNELRKSVRSSLYDKRIKTSSHEHIFGPSTYNEETDEYYHECKCGYSETYEEL